MEFLIPELNPFDWKPIFTGTHSRNPTLTDVKWLSESRLVAANRQAAKLYLLEKTATGFSLIHSIDTIYNGKIYNTDLFDATGNTIFATNFTNASAIYNIVDDKIVFDKELILHSHNKYHGVQVRDRQVFFTCSQGLSQITIYSLDTKEIKHINPERIGENRIKDICFIKDLAILLLNTNSPKDHESNYDGAVALYRFTGTQFRFIQKVIFKDTHLDSVVSKGNKIYATAHSPIAHGQIHVLEVKDNILTLCESKACQGFPHGIDIYKNALAYTSYTTSGIHFLTI